MAFLSVINPSFGSTVLPKLHFSANNFKLKLQNNYQDTYKYAVARYAVGHKDEDRQQVRTGIQCTSPLTRDTN